jgi:predicted helicase
MEVIAISNDLPSKTESTAKGTLEIGATPGDFGADEANEGAVPSTPLSPKQMNLQFQIGELEKAIYAKIVKKCGNRRHWEEWAGDIAKIAQTHITRISAALVNKNSKERVAFDAFLEEIRDDLNESITEQDAIEMLAQHLITKPVFDALFEDYDFARHNPVSLAMQEILEILGEQNLENEVESLEKFYSSVRVRAAGIKDAAAKQKIVLELYEKFFGAAFKKTTQKLGIVYTPVEVVDFIIHSVNDVLQQEFGETLGSKGVHILDPFVGTGTFITRLLQSGLIDPSELKHKFKNEIHANEIVLLAYYIAAINIEAVYHSLSGGEYAPFSGICLTDTFQLYEKEDMISKLLVDNTSRRQRQKELDIKVIFGNPPYSAGQSSANDNNQNVSYPSLDESIRTTYAKHTDATNKNSLYDSYIRAFRWATDRIGESGVVAFVSNAGWIDGNAMDGFRKCLTEDYSSLYVFHLRGNQRTQGEQSRREGGKIFGAGSRAPIAISVLIKNPARKKHGQIFFHDIGDYLSREAKLEKIRSFKSIAGISKARAWTQLAPDEHNDWLNQRVEGLEAHLCIGSKRNSPGVVFNSFSSGLKTNRDAWCYNFSRAQLCENLSRLVNFFNTELYRWQNAFEADQSLD